MNNSNKLCCNNGSAVVRHLHLFVLSIVVLFVASFSSVTNATLLPRLGGQAAFDPMEEAAIEVPAVAVDAQRAEEPVPIKWFLKPPARL